MPKLPAFATCCRLSELPARAREATRLAAARAAAVRRADRLTIPALASLLLVAACTSCPGRHPAAAPTLPVPHGTGAAIGFCEAE